MSRDCTEPRKEKACYNCNQTGHLSRDCPEVNQGGRSGPECYKCGKIGHISRDCYQGGGGYGGFSSGGTCYTCGQTGHRAANCPNGQKCYNCGQTGHISSQCSQPQTKACYQCGQPGHISRECNDYATTFQKADALALVVGSVEDANPYQKGTAIQTWLLAYEFPQTILLFTADKLHVITSHSKAAHLQALDAAEKRIPMEVHVRTKDAEKNKELYKNVLEQVKKSRDGKRLGVPVKDQYKGKVVDEWKEALNDFDTQFEQVDITAGLANVLAVKEEEELRTMRSGARVSSQLMRGYFVEKMSTLIDEEKPITHEQLADMVEKTIADNKVLRGLKLPNDLVTDFLDWCYTPIIQSGGEYDLRSSAISNDQKLHAGTILCSLGIRYRNYCSNIGRTYLIDPNKTQEKTYEFLLDLQHKIIESVKEGVKMKDVYNQALQYIRSKRSDLEQYFVKSLGSSMGIEFRESNSTINAKNNRELESGMILNLSVGFQGIPNPEPQDEKSRVYSLLLVDTVRVTPDGAYVLTDCPKSLNDICYYFKGGDEDEEMAEVKEEVKPRQQEKKSRAATSAILKSKLRNEEQDEDSPEMRRKAHQKELAAQNLARNLSKYSDQNGEIDSEKETVFRKFESYKTEQKLPREVKNLRVMVDHRAESIICPIYGLGVPFHISTVKSVSKSDEGEFVVLRLNFVTPGQAGSKKDEIPSDDVDANFVRALTYRSSDTHRMAEVYKQITDLKRDSAKRDAERREMADIVVQEKLIEVKGRRPIRLGDVFARPGLDGKRVPGEVEIHTNGLRYQSPLRADHRIDILFSNMKHLFFQPCDNELIVIIHIHLKNPIMIGKKKTKDIQFYREASDVQYDETGNRRRRHNYGDEDELEAEQEERRRRAALNREFKQFAEKITEASDNRIEADVPLRELGFPGVPFRSNVLLQPTTDCLVHLSDPPFLVLTLSEIEVAHLERVQFGIKNFDIVFVLKDYSRPVIQINTVPMTQLENVKEWLDSVDIPTTEGPMNLNWPLIMKTVTSDPASFFQEGGWGFLDAQKSDDENSEDESESASEFEVEESDFAESESEESSFDEAASQDEGSEAESVESGEDWDELEEKARRADEKKHGKRAAEDDDDVRKKKRR
ncbi:hypothetical protein BZG36_00744 [Bifiguratus adelaidae]|uniref:FACT complex subunit n=1 Tax=Bifiguratus adelaidae TaxID=1938954 RepID=A0A261Y734_9FUNG|nr:hypothetical protein BZG36_00744 [Bifiguratus adelaidae]